MNEYVYKCRRCGALTYGRANARQDVALLQMFEILAGEDSQRASAAQDRRWSYCSECPDAGGVGVCDLIAVQPTPKGAER